MSRSLIIFGAGDLARLAHRFFVECGRSVVACTVTREHLEDASLDGLLTVPYEDLVRSHPPADHSLFIAIGYRQVNRARAAVYDDAKSRGYTLATLVHHQALVHETARVGDNCLLFPGVVVDPFVSIGNDVIVWSGAVIGHDSVVGDHCFLAPRAALSGRVVLESGCFVGINATIRDYVRLGEHTLVGAGAILKHDSPPNAVYAPTQTDVSDRTSRDYDDL